MLTTHAPPLKFWRDRPESQHVQNTKGYHKTPHGTIFTQSFLPLTNDDSKNNISLPVKATIFMTHGYGSDTSWLFEQTCIRFANYGYAVFAADLIGHGRSDGIPGYIGDMDKAAAASLSFFLSVRRRVEYRELPAFLFGESMGGAISMLMNFQSEPDTWTGLIFSAPLFVCTENTKPSKVHLLMYGLLCGLADTWASMPADKTIVGAVKDINKLKIMLQNPRRYTGRPRVGTKREVARVCDYLQKNFHKVTTPFLTVHGTDDGVTCPSGSKMLYEKAASADKSLKLYEGMYHSLLQGEPDENVDIVLGDMRDWLDERVRMYGKKW